MTILLCKCAIDDIKCSIPVILFLLFYLLNTLISVVGVQSNKPELLLIPRCTRPDHFLRPTKDNSFGMTGTLTYCRSVKGLLPEDTLHCSHLMAIASQLKCEVYEVPVSSIYGNYQLIPGQTYAVCMDSAASGSEQMQGCIAVGKEGVKVSVVSRSGSKQVYNMGLQDWQTELAALKLLVLPMIFRQCAAVWANEKSRVAVLVHQSGRNFDASTLVYKALLTDSEFVYLDAITTLKHVIPIGTMLWIRPESPAWLVSVCVFSSVDLRHS